MTTHDLFTRAEEDDAARAAAAAEAARQAAYAKAKCAPHGQLEIRRQRLQEATLSALQAEVELLRIKRDLRR